MQPYDNWIGDHWITTDYIWYSHSSIIYQGWINIYLVQKMLIGHFVKVLCTLYIILSHTHEQFFETDKIILGVLSKFLLFESEQINIFTILLKHGQRCTRKYVIIL